jgi:hypothetical protein
MIQVRTPCHKIPNFIEMAKRAGVTRVFIGLENVNLDNLAAAKKRQNSINGTPKNAADLEGAGRHYARRMVSVGHAGEHSTPHRDHPGRTAPRYRRVLRPDAVAWLGGSSDRLEKGSAMELDLNRYDAFLIRA